MIAGTETTGYHGKPMTVPADGDEAIGTLPIQYRNREIFRPLYHWTQAGCGVTILIRRSP